MRSGKAWAISMDRRRFIKLASGLLVAAPIAIAVEPVRRFWQVGATLEEPLFVIIHKGAAMGPSTMPIAAAVESAIRTRVERYAKVHHKMPALVSMASVESYERWLRRSLYVQAQEKALG